MTNTMTKRRLLLLCVLLVCCRKGIAQTLLDDALDGIWFAQVSFKVCDQASAGTNDVVLLDLGSGSTMRLDLPGHWFRRNKKYQFAIVPGLVSKSGDIGYLRLSKKGTNGLCLSQLQLRLNKAIVFQADFPGGQWLDQPSNKLEFSLDELKASPHWGEHKQRVGLSLTSDDLHDVLWAMVAQSIYLDGLEWGSGPAVNIGPVNVYPFNASRASVVLYLEKPISAAPDVNLQVSFYLNISCGSGDPALTVSNVTVSAEAGATLLDALYSQIQATAMNVALVYSKSLRDQVAATIKSFKNTTVSLPICPFFTMYSDLSFLPRSSLLAIPLLREDLSPLRAGDWLVPIATALIPPPDVSGGLQAVPYATGGELFLYLQRVPTGNVELRPLHVSASPSDQYGVTTSVSIGQAFENHQWNLGWDIIEPYDYGNQPYLFLLQRDGREQVLPVTADGRLGQATDNRRWSSGWSAALPYDVGGQRFVSTIKKEEDSHSRHVLMQLDSRVRADVANHFFDRGWGLAQSYETASGSYLVLINSDDGRAQISHWQPNGEPTRVVGVQSSQAVSAWQHVARSPRSVIRRGG